MDDKSLSLQPGEKDAPSPDQAQTVQTRLEDFEYDWYIRVKFQLSDLKRVDRAAAVAKMENEIVALFERT
jgi:hypothetical protein